MKTPTLPSTRIYVVAFHAAPVSTTATLAGNEWPYDNGDDPSFRAMRKFSGQLTWGVCRQDVRNAIREGDVAVFFSFRKCSKNGEADYRFCSVATVRRKVSQSDIWQKESLRVFRKYCNLLIRPPKSKEIWKYFEPSFQGARPHEDWLWRIADHDGLRKKDFRNIEKTNRFKQGTHMGDFLVEIAPNYVIFSSDPTKTVTLSNPPVVASHIKGQQHENWKKDDLSKEIKRLTLEESERVNGTRRWLRTTNLYNPHRQIVFELPKRVAEKWRARLLRCVRTR